MTDTISLEKSPDSAGPPASEVHFAFDCTAEKHLLRKLDLRVLPVLWFLYLVNFIDRANIGNAKIQGMEVELNLVGQRFNMAVWDFNLGYLVAGIPMQIVYKKYGPKTLCVMMFFWGIAVIGCGLVKRWEELVVCRLLEGMAESAFIAGAAYLIGAYYTREEYLTRYVFFSTAGIIAGAINGFVSSLIARMDGTSGYSAWRWIFIIEGIFTIGVSIISWHLIVPWPENAKFLPPEEKALLLARVKADGGHIADDEINFKTALNYLKDWKIWTGVAMNLGVTENANSLANFQPTILKGLGYTAVQAQVHTIPVYLTGAAFSLIFAHISAWLHKRYLFYLFGCTVLATGLAIQIGHPPSPAVRYMGMFFIACGCYLSMPISIIWVSINAGKGYKRAVAIAAIINFGTAGAFVSSNVFLKREEPRFRTGFSTGLGLACMGAFAATITYLGCKWENRKTDERRARLPDVIMENVADLGDRHPDFRFVL